MALKNLERYDEALLYFDQALRIDPKDALALNNKANTLCSMGREYDAIKCFDAALAIDPGDAYALYNKANALKSLGRPQEAKAFEERALSIRPGITEEARKKPKETFWDKVSSKIFRLPRP